MATIKRFEDIRAWQSARELVKQIYSITQQKPFAVDFALRDQIRRAAISVMSNIVEGFDAGYKAEFIRFLRLSFRSASEVQSQLYTAYDLKYLTEEEFRTFYSKAEFVKKQINSFMSYLKSNSGYKVSEEPAAYQIEGESFTELDVADEFFSLT